MESESKRKDAAPPIYMNYSNQRKQPEPESAPKPEHDAESGYSSRTAYSDRLKDFNDESIADQPSAARRSPQGSDCSSSGYGSAYFESNRSKDNDPDFTGQLPFNLESFRKIHEALLKSQQEVIRQQEVINQREDLSRQREDLSRQREDLSRQQEDLSRQREDFLRQQEAIRKMGINAVVDEQHLKSGTTHSYESKRIQELEASYQQLRHESESTRKEKEEEIQALKQKIQELEASDQQLRHESDTLMGLITIETEPSRAAASQRSSFGLQIRHDCSSN